MQEVTFLRTGRCQLLLLFNMNRYLLAAEPGYIGEKIKDGVDAIRISLVKSKVWREKRLHKPSPYPTSELSRHASWNW